MRRRVAFFSLLVAACAGPSRVRPQQPTELVPFAAEEADVALGRSAPLYRSGSRLKIRWYETIDGNAKLPLAIYDSTLKTDCELTGGDTPSCIPVAEMADDEKIAFLETKRKSPALIVDDNECVTKPAHTKDDDHLWSLSPFSSTDEQKTFGDPSAIPKRFSLDPARRTDHTWTMEGPGCVVHVDENARGSLCVRPLHLVDTSGAAKAQAGVVGTGSEPVSGILVVVGPDGSILPRRGSPAYWDARNEFECFLDFHEPATCLPHPWDKIPEMPVVGNEVKVQSFQPHPDTWAHYEDGGETTWAKLAPFDETRDRSQPRKVLAIMDMQAAFPFGSKIDGTGRIAMHVRTVPDGRTVPISYYDTKLARDCEPEKTASGTWRCVVKLDMSCEASEVDQGGTKKEVITGSSSFCNEGETCCQGGPVFFPAVPPRPARRFGMEASSPRPGSPERVVRFSETSHVTDHIRGWQDQVQAPVFEKVEDLSESVFAEMKVVQD